MGCSSSKIEDKDLLGRCRERKRFILLAIENRYAFTAAHVAYIQALRNVGISLRQFAEAEMMLMSSRSKSPTMTSELAIMPLNSSSISATPSPLHSVSPLRVGSSRILDFSDSHSPSSYVVQHQMNYMRSKRTQAITVQEGNKGTVESFTSAPQSRVDHDPSPPLSQKTDEPPPQSSGGFWNSLNPFTHLDDRFYFTGHKELSHSPERNFSELKQLREDEGIPDLEESDHGEQSMEEEMEQVRSQKRNSGVDSVDPHTKESAMYGHSAFKSTTSSQDPSADDFTRAKLSAEDMAQSKSETVVEETTAMHAEKANKAGPKMAEDKTDGMGKDKEDLEKEQAIVICTPSERNILDSIKEIESCFLRAYDSGKEVSRMLEANKEYYHSRVTEMEGRSWTSRIYFPFVICCFSDSGVPESHEPSSRAPSLKSWQRTTSQSSSSKTPYISISKGEIDDSSSDFVEDLCMISGSHASTLERLYAWEKKLYDEVKAEERLRSEYEEKCVELRHLEAKGKNLQLIDRTRATVKYLHSRTMVAIHAVDSVSKRIQKLRDEELQPQLIELIQGMIRMWDVMLECHQTQYQIIKDSNTLGSCIVNGMSSDSYRQAIFSLENELCNWHSSFSNWIGAQKAYVQALFGWHQKCILYPAASTKRRSVPSFPCEFGAPLVVIICAYWSQALEPKQKNADRTATEKDDKEGKDVTDEVFEALKNLTENVREVWSQWDGHQHTETRKADSIGSMKSGMHYMLNKKKLNTSKAGSPMVDSRNSFNLHRKPEEEEKMRLLQQTNDSFFQKGLEDIFESLKNFASAYKEKLEEVMSKV